jgi:hypothetical protein
MYVQSAAYKKPNYLVDFFLCPSAANGIEMGPGMMITLTHGK